MILQLKNKKKLEYAAAESYKRLRNNIRLAGENLQVIEITGCLLGAGKTEVSFNLAMSFAELGARVLYIDADLRRSVLIKHFKSEGNVLGLSHYLSGLVSMGEVVAETNVPNLNIILAGKFPPNPAELLSGNRFTDLIAAARKKYDYIIIDTPPLANVVDAQVVAQEVDGVALVVAVKEVSRGMVRRVVNDIKNTGTPFLGIILNKVNYNDKSALGRYYGSYYGKYYGKYYGSYYGETEDISAK